MRKNRRIVTSALALVLCIVMISACALMLTHANHEHDQSSKCATCDRLADAAQSLKQLGAVLIALGFSLTALRAVGVSIRATRAMTATPTPISLKIRMNN